MVDCGNTRCSQERRSFKKELLSWSKKIPIAVGLERIAEELAGENVIKELLLPFNCLENEETEDWKEEQNCFFCESRLQLMFEAVSQLMEEAKNGKSLQDNPSLRYLQELLPYCPKFYTENMGRELLAELKSTAGQSLSLENVENEMNVPQTQREPIQLKIPHIVQQTSKKKESSANCKKSYTDEELKAAVCEIQSGKLGTRRASVLYGIPRSTLRNKIFKMGSEKQEHITQLNGNESPDESVDIHSKWSELLQGTNPAILTLPQMPFHIQPKITTAYNLIALEEESLEKKLEYIRRKHNLCHKKEEYYSRYSQDLRLPVLKTVIKKLAEERIEMERNATRVRQIKVEKKDENKQSRASSPKGAQNISAPSRNQSLTSETFSDIVIPSFKPINNLKKEEITTDYPYQSSLDKIENSRIGETLKDIIVKTISEKVKFKSQALTDYCQNSNTSYQLDSNSSSHDSSHSNSPSPSKRQRNEDLIRKKPQDLPVKKTRPKRGQYRKYNSQLLMEAVKAVQRGEMSVHRAGSYYGVPHSTLEYKVKERHLLRQKKIKEQRQQKEAEQAAQTSNHGKTSGNSSSSSSSSEQGTSSKSSSSKTDNVLKESTKKKGLPAPTWMSPFLSGNPNLDVAGLGIYNATGLALNTPASELLRKLQHKVQSKSGSFDQENGYDQLLGSNSVSSLGEGFLFLN